MLVGAGMHHHVPGIAIQPICPVVVALGKKAGQRGKSAQCFSNQPYPLLGKSCKTSLIPSQILSLLPLFKPSLYCTCIGSTNLGEEMGIRQKQLL
jgi:hypothetical protein